MYANRRNRNEMKIESIFIDRRRNENRNKDSKIAKEKKKLQNLIIEYEKIPKSSSDPKEKKEIFEKLKLTRKEISEQKEVILLVVI